MTFLDLFLPSFADELFSLFEKSAAEVKKRKPNWNKVETTLKSGKLVTESQLSKYALKPKDKRYLKIMADLHTGQEVAKAKSERTGEEYSIRKLKNGRLGCTCGDWRFKRSLAGDNCKHIEGLAMKKTAGFGTGLAGLANKAAIVSVSNERAKRKWRLGAQAAAGEKAIMHQEREKLRPF